MLTEYDRTFLAQYQQVGSETFKKLTVDRKATAIRNLYGAARDVIDAAADTTAHLSRIGYLARLDKVITRRVELLEATRRPDPVAPAAEEVQSS